MVLRAYIYRDQIEVDMSEFKVGDPVVSEEFGEGVVVDINPNRRRSRPVQVEFARGLHIAFSNKGVFLSRINDPRNIRKIKDSE